VGNKGIGSDVLVGVIVYVVTTAIGLLVGNAANLFSHIGLSVLLQLAALFTIPILVSASVVTIARKRGKVRGLNYPGIYVSRSPPEHTFVRYKIRQFGVEWIVEVGTSGGTIYGYSPGPYCPADGCELDRRYVPSLLGSTKTHWRCGLCNKNYPRSRDDYDQENEIVEKVAVAQWRKEAENQGEK
jgi:hypothetical protein